RKIFLREMSSRIDCEVVHAIPGRLRLRLNELAVFDGLREAFRAFVKSCPGVEDVRLNSACRSVVVEYDESAARADDLIAKIEKLSAGRLAESSAGDSPSELPSWVSLGLSTAALVLGAVESAIAPWLLMAAAVPIFGRAIRSLTERGRLNV